MIPKPEEVLKETGVWMTDLISSSTYSAIVESHKEYGRRLLDHVAEEDVEELADQCVKKHSDKRTLSEDGWMATGFVYGYKAAKQSILKIKDEL